MADGPLTARVSVDRPMWTGRSGSPGMELERDADRRSRSDRLGRIRRTAYFRLIGIAVP